MTFVQFCMKVGPWVLLGALVSLPFFYTKYRSVPQSKKQLSLAKFLFLVVVSGVLAFAAGAAIGISMACEPQTAGNLCGLAGFFGTGPLFGGLAIMVAAWMVTRSARLSKH